MNHAQLIKLAKDAEQIAEAVSDAYKPALFARALEELIKKQSSQGEEVRDDKPTLTSRTMGERNRSEKLKTILSSHLNVGEGRQILEKEGCLERSLLVLDIADREFGLPELRPPELAKILSQNLGIATTSNTVSMALKKVTSLYVGRRSEAQGFAYLLIPAGREYLKKKLENKGGGR